MDSSNSAAHHCLLISEIYRLIINELPTSGPPDKYKAPARNERPSPGKLPTPDKPHTSDASPPPEVVNRRTLAALTRTCKALREATIPALWGELDSVVPLLRLFPADTWQEVLLTDGRKTLQLIKPDKLAWTRFDYYAEHVRSLCWEDRRDVSPLALQALAVYRPARQPLLPHLRELVWNERSRVYFPFVSLLLTPTIRTLTLTPPGDLTPLDTIPLLEHTGKMCPLLEKFEIYIATEPGSDVLDCTGVVGDALARFLRGMPELTECILQAPVSTSCVEVLAVHPKLLVVHLHLLPPEMEEVAALAARRSGSGPWFDLLKTFALSVCQLGDNTKTFLATIRSRSLSTLFLESRIQPETFVVTKHMDLVARSVFRKALSAIQLAFYHLSDDANPVLDLGEALRPLYALPYMDTVLVSCCEMDITPTTLEDIANAWHELAILSLRNHKLGRDRPRTGRVPLDILTPLAYKCPNLYMLGLQVHADTIPATWHPALAKLLEQPSPSALRRFIAFDSPIVHPGRVAKFLNALFPALDDITYNGATKFPGDTHRVYERKWSQVQGLLRNKIKARQTSERGLDDDTPE